MRLILVFTIFLSTLIAGPPKVVVFDYGGVVAKVDRRPMLDFLSETLEIPCKKLRKDFASDRLYEALEQPLSYWEKYAKKSLSSRWKEQFEEQKAHIIEEMPGMQELISQLKEQGILVVLLSNTKTHRAKFIERHGGYDSFDPILLSCHLGVKKPDPKIYQILLRTIRTGPSDCLFIDNRSSNVEAGLAEGIDSVVFTSLNELKRELSKRGILL